MRVFHLKNGPAFTSNGNNRLQSYTLGRIPTIWRASEQEAYGLMMIIVIMNKHNDTAENRSSFSMLSIPLRVS